MIKLESYILVAKIIFDEFIINDSLPINDIPTCLYTQITSQINEENIYFWNYLKKNQVDTIYTSLSSDS